jgi:hypothetical protein
MAAALSLRLVVIVAGALVGSRAWSLRRHARQGGAGELLETRWGRAP